MGSRSATRRSHWTRRVLVIGEVALAMVLLVSAGLVLRTLWNWQHLEPGFDASQVMTASLSLRDAQVSGRRQRCCGCMPSRYGRSGRRRESRRPGIGLSLPYETTLNAGARIVDGPAAMEQTAW